MLRQIPTAWVHTILDAWSLLDDAFRHASELNRRSGKSPAPTTIPIGHRQLVRPALVIHRSRLDNAHTSSNSFHHVVQLCRKIQSAPFDLLASLRLHDDASRRQRRVSRSRIAPYPPLSHCVVVRVSVQARNWCCDRVALTHPYARPTSSLAGKPRRRPSLTNVAAADTGIVG